MPILSKRMHRIVILEFKLSYPNQNTICTFRANAATEFSFGKISNINFDSIPVPFVISDFLTTTRFSNFGLERAKTSLKYVTS